ncbi:MAG: hypothetical protein KC613_05310, partial [Myxococcales bacterium]|nr:hypothetical protein [Myxococcales bacterium]
PAPEAPLIREGVVYVVPFQGVTAAELQRAVWALRTQLPQPVQVLPTREVAASTAGEVSAEGVLDALLRDAPDDTFRILGVVHAPLVSEALGPVVGYARRSERALVYSTTRLPGVATEAARRRRVRRIIAHELGHTFGAGHCDVKCVMHSTETATDIDLLPDHYCAEHRAQARAAVQQGLDHPDAVAARAAEQLRLGAWQPAARLYREALGTRPDDVRLHTSLGVALMADGQITAAREAFEAGLHFAPQAAQPYYGLAVLYAAGLAPGRAAAFLEAAVTRDANAVRAHRAAGILYQDVLRNDARAVRHYEAHVQKGGRDPEVIARLTYLISPAMLTFQEPEVVVARWTAAGLMVARATWE